MQSKLDKNQIQKVLEKHIDEKFIAGANLLILKDGEELFYTQAGYGDIENNVKITRDSIFRLYSLTKPVTAAAVMILMERGEIDLYDPVHQYIEGFKNQVVGSTAEPVKRDMTIKDLLSMTSGLVYGGESPAGKEMDAMFAEMIERLYSDHPMTTQETVNRIGKAPLLFQPGECWEYGTSADVLGAIVEVVSGKKFSQFLKDEIFTPLGMVDTAFYVPKEKQSRLVKTYEVDGDSLKVYKHNHLGIIQKMDIEPAFESGGAGLVSTIDDYKKFALMLIQKGTYEGVTILKPKTVEYMISASLTKEQQVGLNNWHTFCGFSYGNLMRVMTDKSKAGDMARTGEYGWDGWLGAYMANFPNENLTILFMIQKRDAGTTSLTRKLRNVILSSIED